MALVAFVYAGWIWLQENPQHNPWAPLDLRQERGWATAAKLELAREDMAECRAVLTSSEVTFTALDPSGEGECRREDRLTLLHLSLTPARPQMTCPVAIGLELWTQDLTPLATDMLGSPIARIEQLGTYSCRRMYGADSGDWSEHATGNAIDIAAFVLEDGRRISVLDDWDDEGGRGQFLYAARDRACASFGTVLSPDYNAAHADHFHLDQGRPAMIGACR
ncbi:extensin family protein [Aurantiacibacter flavus]|uniref:Extensin family protein n=1 Tax=Aurantiacibacter flavus TaxID=3145232 RepID=A0ABV0CU50_9SPHN